MQTLWCNNNIHQFKNFRTSCHLALTLYACASVVPDGKNFFYILSITKNLFIPSVPLFSFLISPIFFSYSFYTSILLSLFSLFLPPCLSYNMSVSLPFVIPLSFLYLFSLPFLPFPSFLFVLLLFPSCFLYSLSALKQFKLLDD